MFKSKSNVVINGISITGSNIQMSNGKIIVDGKELTDIPKDRKITITSDQPIYIQELKSAYSVELTGDVQSIDAGTSVTVKGNVSGDVDAGNSATIKGNVGGSVDAGNSVHCGNVSGNVKAGNSVYH